MLFGVDEQVQSPYVGVQAVLQGADVSYACFYYGFGRCFGYSNSGLQPGEECRLGFEVQVYTCRIEETGYRPCFERSARGSQVTFRDCGRDEGVGG